MLPLTQMKVQKGAEAYQKIYARRWPFFFRADYRYRKRWFADIFSDLGIQWGGEKVLDVGFGSGILLFSLPRCVGIFGVEQAASAVESANRLAQQAGYPEFSFKQFSGEGKIPFEDKSFDYLFCVHVLEHVSDDRYLLREMARVLKPNGLLFLVLPVEREGENPRHLRVYRLPDINRLVRGTFDLIGQEGSYHHARFMLPLIRAHTKWQIPVLGPICDIIHHLLLRIIPYRVARLLDRLLDRLGVEPSQRLYLCRRSATVPMFE